jgi:hypothetical protein
MCGHCVQVPGEPFVVALRLGGACFAQDGVALGERGRFELLEIAVQQ